MSSTSQGTVLAGRYRLERRIQTDPDGSLWRARDATLDRLVCVRVLRPAHPFAADVADAARRAALVDDPRLVRVLDVGSDGNVGFVVSENVNGESLATTTERGLLPGPAIRRIVGEVAEGLAGAAGRGLHHLRLNPRSVMICADGSVKLIGVAVEAAAAGLEPDHAASANRVDAVGLIALIYSGLTGRWPLGDAGFPPAPHGDAGPIAPGELVRGVPNDLDTLCAVTLGPHNDGPRSPAEVARQLAPWPSAEQVAAAAAATASAAASSNRGETPRAAAPAKTSTSTPKAPPPSSLFAPITPVSPDAIRDARRAAGARSSTPPISRPMAGRSPAGQAGADSAAAAGAAAAGTAGTSGASPRTTPMPSGRTGGRGGDNPGARPPGSSAPASDRAPGARPAGAGGAASRTGQSGEPARPAARPSQPGAVRPGAGQPVTNQPSSRQPGPARPAPAQPSQPRGNQPGANQPGGAPPRAGRFTSNTSGSGRPARSGTPSGGVPRSPHDSGELLMPWSGTWTPAPQNSVPTDATGPFPILIPADAPPHEQSRLVLVGVATALVLGLVLAVFSLRDFGGGDDNEQAVTPLTSTSQPSAAQTSTGQTPAVVPSETTPPVTPSAQESSDPPEIAAIKSLDPQGDDKDEHTADSPKAVDGDSGTEWRSNTYNSASFGGLKKGVGLSLRLKKAAVISKVEVDIKGSGGSIQLRGGDAGDYASSELLDSAPVSGGTVTLTSDSTDEYDYVILWITKLPTSGGQHRAEISEVRVT